MGFVVVVVVVQSLTLLRARARVWVSARFYWAITIDYIEHVCTGHWPSCAGHLFIAFSRMWNPADSAAFSGRPHSVYFCLPLRRCSIRPLHGSILHPPHCLIMWHTIRRSRLCAFRSLGIVRNISGRAAQKGNRMAFDYGNFYSISKWCARSTHQRTRSYRTTDDQNCLNAGNCSAARHETIRAHNWRMIKSAVQAFYNTRKMLARPPSGMCAHEFAWHSERAHPVHSFLRLLWNVVCVCVRTLGGYKLADNGSSTPF